jgi:cbb3-type cytochrome oxidase maturation protein
MEVIYSLIPGMMFFGVLFVVVLVWAVKKGQYEDMEGSANRILLDDDEEVAVRRPAEKDKEEKKETGAAK